MIHALGFGLRTRPNDNGIDFVGAQIELLGWQKSVCLSKLED